MNDKYRETGMTSLEDFTNDATKFCCFFDRLVSLTFSDFLCDDACGLASYIFLMINIFRGQHLTFFLLCQSEVRSCPLYFSGMENPVVRQATLRYLSLSVWTALTPSALERNLECIDFPLTHDDLFFNITRNLTPFLCLYDTRKSIVRSQSSTNKTAVENIA